MCYILMNIFILIANHIIFNVIRIYYCFVTFFKVSLIKRSNKLCLLAILYCN